MNNQQIAPLIKRTDIFKVPFTSLALDTDNAREDVGDIESLIQSIKENGVLAPVRGYKKEGVYYVVDGYRRFTACSMLLEREGINSIVPFCPEEKGTTAELRIVNRITLNNGKPYTPLELGKELNKLRKLGWSNIKIAEKTGYSEVYVSNLIGLGNAPEKVKELIREGEISSSAAINWSGEWEGLITKVEKLKKEALDKSDKSLQLKGTSGKVGDKKILPSWKLFKGFSKKVDYKKIDPSKILFYDFLLKVENNEILISDYEDFFMSQINEHVEPQM
jgi:ParB/RepB/Spo0J family partition protein